MGYISIANAEGASNLATLYLSTQAQADIAAAANAVVYGKYSLIMNSNGSIGVFRGFLLVLRVP